MSVKVSQVSERITSSGLLILMDLAKITLVLLLCFGYTLRVSFTLLFVGFQFSRLIFLSDSVYAWIARALLVIFVFRNADLLI